MPGGGSTVRSPGSYPLACGHGNVGDARGGAVQRPGVRPGEEMARAKRVGERQHGVGTDRRQIDFRRGAAGNVLPLDHDLVRADVRRELGRGRRDLEGLRHSARGRAAGIGRVDEGQVSLR